MSVGASTALIERAGPAQLIDGLKDFGATILFTAPTSYRAMETRGAEIRLTRLRRCVSAGEPLPAATRERWRAATGIEILDGLGSTEMLHIFVSSDDDHVRSGATGVVIPGYRAEVVDDDGNLVPPGTIGALRVKGPTGCRYLADDRQGIYVRDGWNYTGDAYRRDQDGYFFYHARTDDMIISAGYNIAGPEVEEALAKHDAVADCAVVGAPDEERGQIVKAFVVLREGFEAGSDLARELQEFVKASVAPYKYPRAIRFIDRIPRTQTGKTQRFRLRETE
jgi:2-aminobenzoate-CoA ligase